MAKRADNRETGLKRKLSPVNVWALALGCIIGWGAFVMPGNKFLITAGPLGTAIAMAVAAVIMIVLAFNYDYMINIYPEAGGGFAFARHSFGRNHAFVCSWFLGLSYLTIVPLNATALALLGRNLLGNVFQFGFHYTVAGYDIYCGELLLAVAALVIFAWINIRDIKFSGGFQTILVFALVAGVAIIGAGALISPQTSMASLAPGFHPDVAPIAGILAIIAIAPWTFLGFDTIPQAAEEFNFSPRKTKAIMIISLLFGGLVYVVLNTVTAAVVPEGYAAWPEYLADLPNLHGVKSLPTFNAAYQILGGAGLVFLGIAVLAAILSGIVGFYMATSRLLYAMARNQYLPKWFGTLHPKYSTPKNAVIFVMLISLTAPFFGRSALNWIVDMSSIGAAIGYGYTSAAAFKHARKEKKYGIAASGALGVLISLAFCVLLLVPIGNLGCCLGPEAYICLGIWTVLGIIFYFSSRKGMKEETSSKEI
ncbi:MAG: APC family permease [Bacteroidales bacterium]|nr:APC family permease [Bacteroidales bacterium]